GVVEGRVDVRDAFRDVLLDLLANARALRRFLLCCHRCSFACLLGRRLRTGARARLLRTLAGARVGTRALTAHRQSAAMPHPAVAAEVHQPLDAHGHFAAQVALDRELADLLANAVHLRVGKVLDLACGLDPGRDQDRLRAWTPDAIDRRQRNLGMLVIRNVDACYTSHRSLRSLCLFSCPLSAISCQQTLAGGYVSWLWAAADRRQLNADGRSPLPLLVTRVRADHAHHTIAADDLAVATDLLDRCQHFHL